MSRLICAGLCAVAAVAGGALVLGQQLPDAPAKAFGTSITAAFEGWYDNPDGTHTFLVGYYNRNIKQAFDIPIGPNNRIEPGGPDLGQPTHFLPGRHNGVFGITVPKAFSPDQRMTWTIVVNDQPTAIPFRLNPDYNISPLKESAAGNTPPAVRLFAENAPAIQGPLSSVMTAPTRTATVGTPLALPVWANDDAIFSSGSNTPMLRPPQPVRISWVKYRGPGDVKFKNAQQLEVLAGGQVGVPFRGKATTEATFSEPGDYVLQLLANDYSGPEGNTEMCCWTNTLLKVTVK